MGSTGRACDAAGKEGQTLQQSCTVHGASLMGGDVQASDDSLLSVELRSPE